MRLDRYKKGVSEGYKQGLQAGMESYDAHFEGTSIIIPSENQLQSLKACIQGIMDQTDLSYEIIVIDNNSIDGTEQYLKQLDGQVRYCILDKSLGEIGAVNRGLMMAKGTTILLLSSQMLPTKNWLENLLLCLYSKTSIGMAGPISNGFSNHQQMHEFARENNKNESSKWYEAEQLSYGCLLFRRELLESAGFMDEGCQEAALSTEDYSLRVRLQGYSLACARDSYVHASGPIFAGAELPSSKSYFASKWHTENDALFDLDAIAKVNRVSKDESREKIHQLGEAAFYPQAVAVKGLAATIYWIEEGVRRPIEGPWELPVVSLSQLNLWRWPIGETISAETLQASLSSLSSMERPASVDGGLGIGSKGERYYFEVGRKRPLIGRHAAESWGLHERIPTALSAKELSGIPDGLPIVSPIKLLQSL